MKKLIALFVALVMCLSVASAAFAEELEVITMTWDEMEPLISEAGLEGDFYKLGGVDVLVWVPNTFALLELTDEEIEDNFIAHFYEGATGNYIVVTLTENGLTFEEGMEKLAEMGFEDMEEIVVNDMHTLTYYYTSDEGSARVSSALFSSGYTLEFTFGIEDEAFQENFVYILSSIQLDAE